MKTPDEGKDRDAGDLFRISSIQLFLCDRPGDRCYPISTMLSSGKIISTMSSWKIILNVVTKLSQRVAKLLHIFSDRPEIPGVDANGKLSTINGTEQHRTQRHKKDLMAESMSLDPISVSRALFRINRSLSR